MLKRKYCQTRADPADRFGEGGKFWPRRPNLPPFSIFSTDLGHFILKLLNFDIFYDVFYLVVGGGGAKRTLRAFGAWPVAPWIRPCCQTLFPSSLTCRHTTNQRSAIWCGTWGHSLHLAISQTPHIQRGMPIASRQSTSLPRRASHTA